jgi:hypothetical protein
MKRCKLIILAKYSRIVTAITHEADIITELLTCTVYNIFLVPASYREQYSIVELYCLVQEMKS